LHLLLTEGESILLINNHRHPILAMLPLRTIQPHGRRIVNCNRISRRHRRRRSYRHEARVDTRCVTVHSDRLAWVIEGGLRDSVVGGRELELHHVTDGGDDVVG